MTQDEIIEMIMQIGGCDRPEDDSPALKMFVTFAKLVAEAEREACAKIVEESSLPDTYSEECLPDIANEIRARGDKNEI